MNVHVPIKENITVGEIITFLEQFRPDVPVPFYIKGEDRAEWVGLYSEDPGEPGFPNYPMIVVSYTKEGA